PPPPPHPDSPASARCRPPQAPMPRPPSTPLQKPVTKLSRGDKNPQRGGGVVTAFVTGFPHSPTASPALPHLQPRQGAQPPPRQRQRQQQRRLQPRRHPKHRRR